MVVSAIVTAVDVSASVAMAVVSAALPASAFVGAIVDWSEGALVGSVNTMMVMLLGVVADVASIGVAVVKFVMSIVSVVADDTVVMDVGASVSAVGPDVPLGGVVLGMPSVDASIVDVSGVVSVTGRVETVWLV